MSFSLSLSLWEYFFQMRLIPFPLMVSPKNLITGTLILEIFYSEFCLLLVSVSKIKYHINKKLSSSWNTIYILRCVKTTIVNSPYYK